jgi:hypothetical protein
MSSSAAMRANVPDPMILQLTTQLGDMEIDNEGLKKERDFYFAKVCFLFHVIHLSSLPFMSCVVLYYIGERRKKD